MAIKTTPVNKKREKLMIEWSDERFERWYKRPVALYSREERKSFRRAVGEGYIGKRG